MREFRPNFISHKRVEAYPIADVVDVGGALTVLIDVGGHRQERLDFPPGAFARVLPSVGDYAVRYEPDEASPEGYLSFSPRAPFEAGYTALEGEVTASSAIGLAATFLRARGPSREISTALTHLDSARLWAAEHDRVKAVPQS